jgi:site-specific DNA-methyltransferase (adenine-specific)
MDRIIQGDALDALRTIEDGSIDCVFTDIAYESQEKHRNVGTTTRLSHSKSSSNDWFTIFPDKRVPELLEELWRVMKPDTHLYLFSDSDS